MEVALCSRPNVRESLELLEMMESIQFSSLSDIWRKRTHIEIDYHPVPVNEISDFGSHDPCERRKIDHHTTTNHVRTISVVPKDISFGWCHEKNDIECTASDKWGDFNGYVSMTYYLPQMNQVPNKPYESCGSSSDPIVGLLSRTTPLASTCDDSAAIRCFLEKTGVLSSGEPAISLSEMCAFVCGRIIQ